MRKLILGVCLSILMSCGAAVAAEWDLGILVNHETVEGSAGVTTPTEVGKMRFGVGVGIKDSEYKLGDASLSVYSHDFLPGLRYHLGFKAVMGEIDDNATGRDGDVGVLGFLLGAEYDLVSKANPANFPISTYLDITGAPKPLCFNDTETYLDLALGLRFHLVETGAVIVEYKYLRADFEDSSRDWDYDDHTVLVGYRINF